MAKRNERCLTGYFFGFLGSFLVVAWIVWRMYADTHSAAITADRANERIKARMEVAASGAQGLDTYGYVDQAKGIVRLPIERAMQMSLEMNQNPAAARSNLIARLEKATFVPPKAPEKPSQFE